MAQGARAPSTTRSQGTLIASKIRPPAFGGPLKYFYPPSVDFEDELRMFGGNSFGGANLTSHGCRRLQRRFLSVCGNLARFLLLPIITFGQARPLCALRLLNWASICHKPAPADRSTRRGPLIGNAAARVEEACYCRPVGFEVEPIGVGAVPSAAFPWILLLLKDCVVPLNAVPLRVISLLDSRMIGVPKAF
jgi:hypothetical protein